MCEWLPSFKVAVFNKVGLRGFPGAGSDGLRDVWIPCEVPGLVDGHSRQHPSYGGNDLFVSQPTAAIHQLFPQNSERDQVFHVLSATLISGAARNVSNRSQMS